MRVTGEPWAECSICGFDSPQSEMVRHYRSRKLVDRACADAPSQADILEWWRMPVEQPRFSEQPVTSQGSTGPAIGFGLGAGFGLEPFGNPTS